MSQNSNVFGEICEPRCKESKLTKTIESFSFRTSRNSCSFEEHRDPLTTRGTRAHEPTPLPSIIAGSRAKQSPAVETRTRSGIARPLVARASHPRIAQGTDTRDDTSRLAANANGLIIARFIPLRQRARDRRDHQTQPEAFGAGRDRGERDPNGNDRPSRSRNSRAAKIHLCIGAFSRRLHRVARKIYQTQVLARTHRARQTSVAARLR
jgi:hypothetical protein